MVKEKRCGLETIHRIMNNNDDRQSNGIGRFNFSIIHNRFEAEMAQNAHKF